MLLVLCGLVLLSVAVQLNYYFTFLLVCMCVRCDTSVEVSGQLSGVSYLLP